MPESEGARMALILYRLEQIETRTEATQRWQRQVMAGVLIALTLPITQLVFTVIRLSEGT